MSPLLEKLPDVLQKPLARSFLHLPTNLLSRGWGSFSRSPASRHFIEPFARLTGVAVAEAERPLEQYATLNDFFTRRLRPGARRIDDAPDSIVSPVDGAVSAFGECRPDTLVQVKGLEYDLFSLLRDVPASRSLQGGSYLTLYLSPPDYHWIHAPMDMEVVGLGYMPGALLPVNPPSVRWVPELYCHNERVMIYAQGSFGTMVVVLVGACGVGSIRLAFHDLSTNRYGAGPRRMNFDKPVFVGKGMDLGVFEMGSTVILLFSREKVQLAPPAVGRQVRLGQPIGKLVTARQLAGGAREEER